MGAIITKKGLEKISQATVDKPLIIEKFAVGDTNGKNITINEAMKTLTNEKFRDFVADKYIKEGNTVFEMVIKATASINEGFYIKELGLFDKEGDLIVITDVPVQYRPATGMGNCITELSFCVNLKIEKTNVIEIKVNENLFITIDMFDRFKKNLIESSVGIDKWFNIDNTYKDQDLVKIGIKTYALMDASNILKIKDFPILFKNLNVRDLGDGTFKMPNFYDGTLRQIKKGSTRELGSYEEDAMQKVYGSVDCITYVDLSKPRKVVETSGMVKESLKSIYKEGTKYGGSINWWKESTVSFDNSDICSVAEETRMKNTAGQWYLLAKLDI